MKTDKYVGLMEVARRTGISYWRIAYAHHSGKIPFPLKAGNRYLYAQKDITKIKEYFDKKEKENQ